jgi:hypothetical protein
MKQVIGVNWRTRVERQALLTGTIHRGTGFSGTMRPDILLPTWRFSEFKKPAEVPLRRSWILASLIALSRRINP